MHLSLPTRLALAAVLVLGNAGFVAAKLALRRARVARLKELAAAGSSAAELALRFTQRLDDTLTCARLGTALTTLGLGLIGAPALAQLLAPAVRHLPGLARHAHGVALGLGFLLLVSVQVVIAEIVPRALAVQHAERIAVLAARPLRLFALVTAPLGYLLTRSGAGLTRLLGLRPRAEAEAARSREELRAIVTSSAKKGAIDEATRDLLDNVMAFGRRVAREIMTPRRDVVVIDVKMPVAEAIALAIEKEYTRYPLCDLDSDRVLGFLHIKDLPAVALGRRKISSLLEIARTPLIVPEKLRIDRLRRQFQAGRTHFGIVVDDLGDFTGIVTLEDLLEEIVGDIQDELDRDLPALVTYPDGSAEMDGGLLLEKATRKLGLRLTEIVEGVDTIGGYVVTLLARAPVAGDHVIVGDHRLEVLQVDEMRIRRLRAVPLPPPSPGAGETARG